jgi:hypothetical protein
MGWKVVSVVKKKGMKSGMSGDNIKFGKFKQTNKSISAKKDRVPIEEVEPEVEGAKPKTQTNVEEPKSEPETKLETKESSSVMTQEEYDMLKLKKAEDMTPEELGHMKYGKKCDTFYLNENGDLVKE